MLVGTTSCALWRHSRWSPLLTTHVVVIHRAMREFAGPGGSEPRGSPLRRSAFSTRLARGRERDVAGDALGVRDNRHGADARHGRTRALLGGDHGDRRGAGLRARHDGRVRPSSLAATDATSGSELVQRGAASAGVSLPNRSRSFRDAWRGAPPASTVISPTASPPSGRVEQDEGNGRRAGCRCLELRADLAELPPPGRGRW